MFIHTGQLATAAVLGMVVGHPRQSTISKNFGMITNQKNLQSKSCRIDTCIIKLTMHICYTEYLFYVPATKWPGHIVLPMSVIP